MYLLSLRVRPPESLCERPSYFSHSDPIRQLVRVTALEKSGRRKMFSCASQQQLSLTLDFHISRSMCVLPCGVDYIWNIFRGCVEGMCQKLAEFIPAPEICNIIDPPLGVHDILEIHNDDYVTAFMAAVWKLHSCEVLWAALGWQPALIIARLRRGSHTNIVASVERTEVLSATSVLHQMSCK